MLPARQTTKAASKNIKHAVRYLKRPKTRTGARNDLIPIEPAKPGVFAGDGIFKSYLSSGSTFNATSAIRSSYEIERSISSMAHKQRRPEILRRNRAS